MKDPEIEKARSNRGKGPLFGWRGNLQETTDTFDIATFLKTDGPITSQERADLLEAIAGDGTFGDYRRIIPSDADGGAFYLYGPNSVLFTEKGKVGDLLRAIEALPIAEPVSKELLQVTE